MYNPNFCFAIPAKIECNDVELQPFVPDRHAESFFAATAAHPELYAYLPWGPFSSTSDFVKTLIEGRIQPDHGAVLFAVLDKPSRELRGIIGLLRTSPTNLSTELGFVIILPKFQGTHITRCAGALLLKFVLGLPEEGGLGLRRAVWQANSGNGRSIRVAERMGFRREGLLRWERTLPGGKEGSSNGKTLRDEDPLPNNVSRDTVLLSVCWDDWEEGGVKQLVEKLLQPS
ncbi:Glycoside hydrolase family 1 protein [Mycena indigotica]|uniref:Glycoside hydrolase family 1 protein n=1 Tax=Mycena indigotica TaxID=2126181 RepID=A0A8H6SSF9_9AGAR|nr:Glycoside hydrolase family 1 protein [Mycena indigotica]KAF7303851.1 Glycoside hydrolase family 1 protein [Mycena indigotica]